MKPSVILLIIILLVLGIGFFTKPSNEYCVEKAKESIGTVNEQVPGYSNPLNPDDRPGSEPRPDQIMITDRFLWKEIRYASSSNVKLLGYAYLNKFHKVSEKKAE